jgi:hypothetical protein
MPIPKNQMNVAEVVKLDGGRGCAVTKTQLSPLSRQGRRDRMRQLRSAAHNLGQILTKIVNARLPMSVWLDSTTLHLYKTRS